MRARAARDSSLAATVSCRGRGDLVCAVDYAGEAADDDVGDRRRSSTARMGTGRTGESPPFACSFWREATARLGALARGGRSCAGRERGFVAWCELEREVETADARLARAGLEAGRRPALLPAGDHGALATGSLRELVLREACSQPGLTDEVAADHRRESTTPDLHSGQDADMVHSLVKLPSCANGRLG